MGSHVVVGRLGEMLRLKRPARGHGRTVADSLPVPAILDDCAGIEDATRRRCACQLRRLGTLRQTYTEKARKDPASDGVALARERLHWMLATDSEELTDRTTRRRRGHDSGVSSTADR